MSLDLQSLKPAATFAVEAIQPDTGTAFTVRVASPWSATGERATAALFPALERTREDADAAAEAVRTFVATVLVALPDVTVDGQPLVIRDVAHAAEVLAALPYLVPQIKRAYMERVRFLAERLTRSSRTSATSDALTPA